MSAHNNLFFSSFSNVHWSFCRLVETQDKAKSMKCVALILHGPGEMGVGGGGRVVLGFKDGRLTTHQPHPGVHQ